MGDQPLAEKAFCSPKGSVNKLIGYYEMPGWQFFTERTYSGNGQNVGHPQPLHRVDIRAGVQVARPQIMPPTMAR